MGSEAYHEPYEKLSDATRDMHRAIASLMEELEAVDWYNQRIDVTQDEELKAILIHNRDEEKEHAAMTLEWIRRRDPVFDKELRDWLFTTKSLAHGADHSHDGGDDGDGGEPHTPVQRLSIGSLRDKAEQDKG
jgi:ferritin-like protein